ncbi:MAG: TMEM43 family protein, partial [Nitrospinota bacterium]|nr:TMEM43 family protein [Nitrospinota bacterium]
GYTGLTARAIKLRRVAEMYQWKETTKKKEERTEYYYDKVWSQARLNSSNFHNQVYSNPSSMRVASEIYKAENVAVGDFRLSTTLVSAISVSEPYPVTEAMYQQFSDSLRREALLYSGGLYLGVSPQTPEIGDIKVKYEVYPEQEVSVVAKQQNGRAVGYTTSNGRVLEVLYSGFKTAEEIFAAEHTKNVILTWVIRGAGILLMYIGLMLSVGQLAKLFSWIPLLGSMVASGIALVAGLLSVSLSFIVISVAWIFYRPTLGIGLLLVAGFLLFVLIKRSRGEEDGEEIIEEPPPPPPLPTS